MEACYISVIFSTVHALVEISFPETHTVCLRITTTLIFSNINLHCEWYWLPTMIAPNLVFSCNTCTIESLSTILHSSCTYVTLHDCLVIQLSILVLHQNFYFNIMLAYSRSSSIQLTWHLPFWSLPSWVMTVSYASQKNSWPASGHYYSLVRPQNTGRERERKRKRVGFCKCVPKSW